jgi:hypothetical protein
VQTGVGSILDWHPLDHHQITSTTITWNQDCPPWSAGSPHPGPGPGYCSNRKQLLNSSRKGRQDSHARVQTVQAGRGPGGWTHPSRRGWNVAGMTYHTQYRPNLWYRRENFDIGISRYCTDILYDIKVFTFDIGISRCCRTISYSISIEKFDITPISSVQRRSDLTYRSRYRWFFFDIVSISSVQRRSFPVFVRPQYRIWYRIRYRYRYVIKDSYTGPSLPRPPSSDSNEDCKILSLTVAIASKGVKLSINFPKAQIWTRRDVSFKKIGWSDPRP